MRPFKLTIAYDGTDYAGWQVQPGRPTIQGHLQQALLSLTGEAIAVVGSGRTDAGVHAWAQVASCTLRHWSGTAKNLADAINTKLPDTIAVTHAIDAPAGFHAIRDAVSKRYRYQIRIGGGRNAFDHRYRWLIRHELDLASMQLATAKIIGEHDFASFQAAGAPRQSTVRHVRDCLWKRDTNIEWGTPPSSVALWSLEIEANGFLYNMVRNIVGTLIEVGRGKYPPDWIEEVLAARNRDVAGPTAPAHGLFLQVVDYFPFDSPPKGPTPF